MKMFIKYMSTLCVLFLFVSCSSTTYTKIDEPNYKRYNHDQKIELGMTVEEVLNSFGSPSHIDKTWGNKMMVIEFRYYRAIHCQEMMCFVQFDEESRKVVNYINFRGEYINFMKKQEVRLEREELQKMLDKAEKEIARLKEELKTADCYQTTRIMHDLRNKITIFDFAKLELDKSEQTCVAYM